MSNKQNSRIAMLKNQNALMRATTSQMRSRRNMDDVEDKPGQRALCVRDRGC